MAITLRPREQAEQPPRDATLSIDPALLEQPAARLAYQRGLLRAKTEALRSAERLAGWARPLLISVLLVSFLHLWHQIARIAPAGVPALPLPAWSHWLSAALLTASVDATALYLVSARSAAQYARLGEQGRGAVWFFYVLTAALNSVFVLSYTPGLPAAVQAVTPMLSLLGAVLLGLLVPVSIAAVERAHQVANTARLTLLVEVETLRGIVAERVSASEPQGRPVTAEAPSDAPALTDGAEAFQRSNIGIAGITKVVADRACPSCGAALNAAQYGAARKWGWCRSCKPATGTSATTQSEVVRRKSDHTNVAGEVEV